MNFALRPSTGLCLWLVALVLAGLAGAQDGPGGWPPAGTRIGQAFPDLPYPRLKDGALTRPSAYRGQKVLLIQFASW